MCPHGKGKCRKGVLVNQEYDHRHHSKIGTYIIVCKSEAILVFLYSNPLNFRKEFIKAQESLPTS